MQHTETPKATFVPKLPFPLASTLESLVSPSISNEQYFSGESANKM